MEKIALITDSASDINSELIKKYNIHVLPFKIIFSDKEYKDGVDITPSMLYEKLPTEIPTTSLPSISEFTELLEKLKSDGYTHAIIITISNCFSGTFNAARLASESVSDITTFVFDSLTLTMSEGAMVLETAALIEEGKSFNEITNELPTIRKKIDVFFTLDTLTYLKKGGRIGKVAGTIAEALNIKPIITIKDDGFHTYSKVRGTKQSISKLSSILNDYLAKGKCKVWIMNGDAPDKADLLYNAIKNSDNLVECTLGGMIGPALGVNTGPGLVGFIVEMVD
ncbi:MAG: DegV family protein [Clostridium butyricum]|uniref:DegV family protein n=1 Tax=Clostridium butyricum TaxID=1492 RepID=UPI000F529278|nr:DegV family protein [Clostridium butyricum]MDU4751627.1 DegV family protein [Clostridium butyricum]RQN09848.1 DegV family protein [Clostridium butyricum]